MAKNDNMTPADYPTRAELRAELANHPTHAQLATALAEIRTSLRAEIAADTQALLEQFEVRTRAANSALLEQVHADTRAANAVLLEQVHADTRETNAVLLEDAFKRFRVIDDQYKDLPGRVQKLEEVVFPPTPRGRRKRSG